jgi:hypothetical protein
MLELHAGNQVKVNTQFPIPDSSWQENNSRYSQRVKHVSEPFKI